MAQIGYRMVRAGVRLLVLVFGCVCVCVSGHVQPPHVRGITIVPSDKREAEGYRVTSELPSGQSVACTFKFRTATIDEVTKEAAPVPVAPVVAGAPPPVDFNAVINALGGTCTTKKIDYWDYELCFGGGVKQIHQPDVYLLGATGKVDGITLKYADGLLCDALSNKPPRSVTVTFACDRNAATPTIVRVNEVSTCQYALLVGASVFCSAGDTRFEDVTGVAFQQPSASQASNADPSAEDWFIELTPLSDGRAVCSVYSLEMRAAGSKLHFKSFDLSLSRTGGSTPASTSTASGERPFTARHPGRVDCADNEIVYSSAASTAQLRSAPLFNGKLAYLKACCNSLLLR